MNVIKATLALNSRPVWIVLDKITMITINDQQGAVVTVGGDTIALTDTPEQVIAAIDKLLK